MHPGGYVLDGRPVYLEGGTMETRHCRSCGAVLPRTQFRRVPRGTLRICRPCESRRAQRWRFHSLGRPVPARLQEPELTLGEHLRILGHEALEQRGGE